MFSFFLIYEKKKIKRYGIDKKENDSALYLSIHNKEEAGNESVV